jgi:hypothetical protein
METRMLKVLILSHVEIVVAFFWLPQAEHRKSPTNGYLIHSRDRSFTQFERSFQRRISAVTKELAGLGMRDVPETSKISEAL